jgi:hypothetical protein
MLCDGDPKTPPVSPLNEEQKSGRSAQLECTHLGVKVVPLSETSFFWKKKERKKELIPVVNDRPRSPTGLEVRTPFYKAGETGPRRSVAKI